LVMPPRLTRLQQCLGKSDNNAMGYASNFRC
jgi:hypothetical protein